MQRPAPHNHDLSGQVNSSRQTQSVEEQQRSLVDLERLSRAEQRAEVFAFNCAMYSKKESDIQGSWTR